MDTEQALLVGLVFYLISIPGLWAVFDKSGMVPGWHSLIPIVNLFHVAVVAGRPAWWGLLLLVPIIGVIFWLIICVDLAARFSKSSMFGAGLFALFPLFIAILGIGGSQYYPVSSPRSVPTEAPRQERPCPFCAEPILAAARKCKHCGEMVESLEPNTP